jgi:hypothetical protein
MARVQCIDVQARPPAFLACTSVTRDEFQRLVPPCAVAFQAHLVAWRLDGTLRTARRCTVDKPGPLSMPADRLVFLLVSLKTSALHVGHGRLCGMGQSTAHQWMQLLLPVLRTALRPLSDAPARSLSALAERRGDSEADTAIVVAPREEAAAPEGVAPVAAPDAPLWPMTGRHGAWSAPKILRNRPHVRAARQRTPPSQMSCSSMRCS